MYRIKTVMNQVTSEMNRKYGSDDNWNLNYSYDTDSCVNIKSAYFKEYVQNLIKKLQTLV